MEKTILYPFSITEDNQVSYQKTLELAEQMEAKVVCFSRVAAEDELDDVYLHLLSLNGYYQTATNDWQAPKNRIERNIKVGKMESQLLDYLNEEEIDVLIKEPSIGKTNMVVLEEWIKKNKSDTEVYCFKRKGSEFL